MKMVTKPNFLILGAAKAGTTSLYEILRQHPQCYLPYTKEPSFFSDDDNFVYGFDWYLNTYFKTKGNFAAFGEATPSYLYWAEKTAPRIHDLLSAEMVRFIIILREPVARAYSWYWNMVKEGQESLFFEDAVNAEPDRLKKNHEFLYNRGKMTYGYIRGGYYAQQIEVFLNIFPHENFLFLLWNDLITRFEFVEKQMKSFLDLEADFKLEPKSSNQATLSYNLTLQKWLRERSKIKDLIKKAISPRLSYDLKEVALRLNRHAFQYPPMSKLTEKTLKAQFVNDNNRLGELIGRDLSDWNKV